MNRTPPVKFKLISKSTHSIEELFPLPRLHPLKSQAIHFQKLSNPPKHQELSQLAKQLFDGGSRMVCAVKKFANTLKSNYTFFKLPFDLTEGQSRTHFRILTERIRTLFELHQNRPVFLFDSKGNPVTNLSGFLSDSCIILVSNSPKLEYKID